MATLDGYDGSYLACPRINLWHDFQDRAKPDPETGLPVVAVVPHGTEVEVVERDGEGVLVEVGDARGWVRYWFVKEMKGEWQRERLALEASEAPVVG